MSRISHIRIIELAREPSALPVAPDADLDWAKKRGVDIERLYHDTSSDDPFDLSRPFPQIFVDGCMVLSGRYPTREEIGLWMMFGIVPPSDKSTGGPRPCTL